MDDDDLKELRSAALASLSAKPSPNVGNSRDEEDLDALRTAALMTRKQKQIQVIQRPSESVPRIQVPISLRNIPPPPLLVPLSIPLNIPPPPIFSRPPVAMWPPKNLINLTPTPITVPPPMYRPAISNVRPLMSVRVPLQTSRPIAPQRYRAMPKIRPQVTKPISKTVDEPPVSTEQKVPDKFSRYDPDSSSDEDDDHAAAKKKEGENAESDAESVASKKSFSSVSDGNESVHEVEEPNGSEKEDPEDEKTEVTSEAMSDPGTPVQDEPCEDDISIIGDNEDDILAAIDDFLEDKPAKVEPKKVVRKNSAKKQDKQEKPKKARIPIVYDRSSTQKEPLIHKSASKPKRSPAPVKVSETIKPSAVKIPDVAAIKQKPEIKSKQISTERKNQNKPISSSKNVSTIKPVNPVRVEPPPTHGTVADVGYMIPVVSKRKAPSPRRQRRDSDLDSVGTSDLSFLSSDDDKEKIAELKERPKRPRTRSVSDEMERRRNERLKIQNRVSKPPKRRDADTQPVRIAPEPDNEQKNDLRKKLENKGIKKRKPAEAQQRPSKPDDVDKTLSNTSSRPRTGVISLKSRSSRFDAAKLKNQREGSDDDDKSLKNSDKIKDRKIVITASVSRGTRAVQESTIESRTNVNAIDPVPSRKTKHKDSKPRNGKSDRTVVSSWNAEMPTTKKTVILSSTDKKSERKTSRTARSPIQFNIQEASGGDAISEKNSSDQSSSSESDNEVVFNEEEIFAFSHQDLADYDEVLGDITDDVEPTPNVRRRSSSKKGQHKKGSEYPEIKQVPPKRKRNLEKDDREESPSESRLRKDKTKEIPHKAKISIHQRLGRQDHIDEMKYKKRKYDNRMEEASNETLPRRKIITKQNFEENHEGWKNSPERENKTQENMKRRILVSKRASPGENTEPRKAVKDRLGNKDAPRARKIISTSPGRDSKHYSYDPQKTRRAKVTVKRKKIAKQPGVSEVILEEKIQRIKQQNGKILKRQMEIQKEKEKFG